MPARLKSEAVCLSLGTSVIVGLYPIAAACDADTRTVESIPIEELGVVGEPLIAVRGSRRIARICCRAVNNARITATSAIRSVRGPTVS